MATKCTTTDCPNAALPDWSVCADCLRRTNTRLHGFTRYAGNRDEDDPDRDNVSDGFGRGAPTLPGGFLP